LDFRKFFRKEESQYDLDGLNGPYFEVPQNFFNKIEALKSQLKGLEEYRS
jgi:hypothetical protein